MKQKLTETMANNHNIPTVGEWELDLLTRLRVQRERREHARTQILLEADLLIDMAQGIMATAHPQPLAAHNMLWALQHRMSILRIEWIGLDNDEEYDMGLEQCIWARCR
ncbi:hypothetical protein N7519_001538 [Penicillium mononematosum]|uniref:uncharacterized protein n=1 Tax=Penicillium mononematosum TaxID=268346 RepID=UPI00254736A8|nr:uncharacterized protein N7519_001538 [Penicillium mononematosum]KAJ6191517.1 hypothetical protein N7519_001538 [Penicillium mononematosum]